MDIYRLRLKDLDASVCEAIAVSQAISQRMEAPAVGYSTYVFSRICLHAQSLMCAAPKSRWVRRKFEIWDISTVASHARSILEGYLLFRYLADAPSDPDVQRVYLQVMHMYDCKKRMAILPYILPEGDIKFGRVQEEKIRSRLESSEFFQSLDDRTKKGVLAGRTLTIRSRSEIVSDLKMDKEEFNFLWNYLSQYTHVLSFSFYRIEPNGRGTGLMNEHDLRALCMVLKVCRNLIDSAVDRLIEIFPDASESRKGINSKFSPGPARNLPRWKKRSRSRGRRGAGQ